MRVTIDIDDSVTLVGTREDLEILESGLYCYISEYLGVDDAYVEHCKRLLTDIANLEYSR